MLRRCKGQRPSSKHATDVACTQGGRGLRSRRPVEDERPLVLLHSLRALPAAPGHDSRRGRAARRPSANAQIGSRRGIFQISLSDRSADRIRPARASYSRPEISSVDRARVPTLFETGASGRGEGVQKLRADQALAHVSTDRPGRFPGVETTRADARLADRASNARAFAGGMQTSAETAVIKPYCARPGRVYRTCRQRRRRRSAHVDAGPDHVEPAGRARSR